MNNMRKFLYVSFTSEQSFTGGMQCCLRNLQSIETLFGKENVDSYIIKPYQNRDSLAAKFKRVFDIFQGYMGGLQKSKEKEILKTIADNNYTDVYIDSSLLGLLSKSIKRSFPKIRIYTFFHNIEYDFVKASVVVNHDYLRFYWLPLARINERAACRYSDKVIVLNERDAMRLQIMYKRVPDTCIPITFRPNYTIGSKEKQQLVDNHRKQALFIGSYFYGNVEGLKWFCRQVLPSVDLQMIVVGAGMNQLKNDIDENEKLIILSDVPDLAPYYEKADFMILPILSGGGMKVKTAEALMYGKYILATMEALTGYDVNPSIAIQCNSADEFIQAITNLSLKYKFNEPSRKLFDEKYSFDVSLALFKTIFYIK